MTNKIVDLRLVRAKAEPDARNIKAIDALQMAIDALEKGEISPDRILVIAQAVPDAESDEGYLAYFTAGLSLPEKIGWLAMSMCDETARGRSE
jgi:hypothetical protein